MLLKQIIFSKFLGKCLSIGILELALFGFSVSRTVDILWVDHSIVLVCHFRPLFKLLFKVIMVFVSFLLFSYVIVNFIPDLSQLVLNLLLVLALILLVFEKHLLFFFLTGALEDLFGLLLFDAFPLQLSLFLL